MTSPGPGRPRVAPFRSPHPRWPSVACLRLLRATFASRAPRLRSPAFAADPELRGFPAFAIAASASIVVVAAATSLPSFARAAPAPDGPSAPMRFEKGASRFCFTSLAAPDQSRLYGRVVNLGASFTHGCIGCDGKDADAQANELTGDAAWIRRHYLAHFFTGAGWKPPNGRAQGVFALENDPQDKPTALVPPARTVKEGYSGVWHWSPARDDFQLLSRGEALSLLSGSDVLAGADLVGGFEHRPDIAVREGRRHGVALASYAMRDGRYVPMHEAFDFAVDGGRMQDLFRRLGAADLIPELEASRWAPGPSRDEAVRRVVERLSATRPGTILAIDILFWDAIARTLAIAREDGTRSLVLRFLIAALERTPAGRELFDQERISGVRAAFYEVLERVSRGDDGRGGTLPHPPPILLARLLDDAAPKLRAKGYEPVIAALLGEFVARFTGKNVAGDMVDWLRAEVDGGKSNATNAFGPRLTPSERARAKAALAALEERGAREPTGRDDASGLPRLAQGVATWLLLDVLKEAGSLLEGLGRAMDESNVAARAVATSTSNNIHLVDADEFYLSFGEFLKPQTMHPSVAGSRRMADMLTRAVCSSPETP